MMLDGASRVRVLREEQSAAPATRPAAAVSAWPIGAPA
jgi:hypothetical protein